MAQKLLRRNRLVFREILARESLNPSRRVLLAIYWPLEDRGEVRGGRFVDRFIGEQFALPAAVEALRAVRRKKEGQGRIILSAADPLNLVGILTPGSRVPPNSNLFIAFEDGVPVDVGDLGALRHRLQRLAAAS